MRPGLSQENFRRFEHIIIAALENWPDGHIETAKDGTIFNLAKATFVARLRDAIRSFRLYKWESEVSELMQAKGVEFNGLCVSETTDEVRLSAPARGLLMQPLKPETQSTFPTYKPNTLFISHELLCMIQLNVIPRPCFVDMTLIAGEWEHSLDFSELTVTLTRQGDSNLFLVT